MLPLLGAGRPQGAQTAGSIPFIAVPPVPAFLALALVGFSAGPVQPTAGLADSCNRVGTCWTWRRGSPVLPTTCCRPWHRQGSPQRRHGGSSPRHGSSSSGLDTGREKQAQRPSRPLPLWVGQDTGPAPCSQAASGVLLSGFNVATSRRFIKRFSRNICYCYTDTLLVYRSPECRPDCWGGFCKNVSGFIIP